jgi:hypothetical protein
MFPLRSFQQAQIEQEKSQAQTTDTTSLPL